jgi:hypothetical protein
VPDVQMGGLGMCLACDSERSERLGPFQLQLLAHLKSYCPLNRSTPSLFYLFYHQSLASSRLSFPSPLSFYFVALPYALLAIFCILSLYLSIPRGKRFIPMFSRRAFPAFILSLALVVFADPDPIVPDPGHIFNEGSTCQIGWNPDTTGQWQTMNIELMTGNNLQMVHLTSSSSCFFFVK